MFIFYSLECPYGVEQLFFLADMVIIDIWSFSTEKKATLFKICKYSLSSIAFKKMVDVNVFMEPLKDNNLWTLYELWEFKQTS